MQLTNESVDSDTAAAVLKIIEDNSLIDAAKNYKAPEEFFYRLAEKY